MKCDPKKATIDTILCMCLCDCLSPAPLSFSLSLSVSDFVCDSSIYASVFNMCVCVCMFRLRMRRSIRFPIFFEFHVTVMCTHGICVILYKCMLKVYTRYYDYLIFGFSRKLQFSWRGNFFSINTWTGRLSNTICSAFSTISLNLGS